MEKKGYRAAWRGRGLGGRNLRCCHCFLNYGGGGFLRPGCCGDGDENGGLHGIIRRIDSSLFTDM